MIERIQQEFAEWWESILEISPSILLGTIFLILFILLGKFSQGIFVKRSGVKTDDSLLTNFLGNFILDFCFHRHFNFFK
tara:strand:+ start:42948 stop:43184 length:237 start_codon:yes stop_codon:yes gene_type:complete